MAVDVEALMEHVSTTPGDRQARYKLARWLHYNTRQWRQAEEHYALLMPCDDGNVYYDYGLLLYQDAGDAALALDLLLKALKLNCNHADAAHARCACILCDKKEYAAALPHFRSGLPAIQESPIMMQRCAETLCALKAYDEAVGVASQAVAMDPRYAKAHYIKAVALINSSFPAHAGVLAAFEAAIRLEPENYAVVVEYATYLAQHHASRHADAIAMVERVVSGPNLPADAWVAAASFYRAIKQPATAVQCAASAVKLTPLSQPNHCCLFTLNMFTLNNISASLVLAQLYLESGNIGKAKTHFDQALRVNPKHCNTLLACATFYETVLQVCTPSQFMKSLTMSLQDYMGAKHLHLRYLKLCPGDVAVSAHLAKLLETHLGDYTLAKVHYEAAIASNADDYIARLSLASLLQNRLYDSVGAKMQYEHVLRLDPDNVDGLSGLALVFEHTMNDFVKCRELLSRAVSLRPSDGALHARLGTLLADRFRNVDEAKGHFEAAMQCDPMSAESWLRYGLFYEKHMVSEKAQALLCFRKALAVNAALAEAQMRLEQGAISSLHISGFTCFAALEDAGHVYSSFQTRAALTPHPSERGQDCMSTYTRLLRDTPLVSFNEAVDALQSLDVDVHAAVAFSWATQYVKRERRDPSQGWLTVDEVAALRLATMAYRDAKLNPLLRINAALQGV